MKWVIASDIHGSEFYCRRLTEAYEREKADRLLLLGDLLYHGPRNDLPRDYAPKKVIELLNALKNDILCVRGNCEAEVDQMVLDFPVMADYALIPLGKRLIFATHGHLFNKDELPPLKAGDILLYGHTHVPICEIIHRAEENGGSILNESAEPVQEADPGSGIICMNPGSVSIPKQNSPFSYMTLETAGTDAEQTGLFKWKTLDGETYRTFEIR